jgi:hypothetical protein
MRVKFHPDARTELRAAHNWYIVPKIKMELFLYFPDRKLSPIFGLMSEVVV